MATKNLIGNPNGIIENEVNHDVAHSGYSDGISSSHLTTMNEGEIKLIYDELLEPNSEIRLKNRWLAWQSPLVTRNLTNQKVRSHYVAQSIKNQWADWRSYIFGGRYGDFSTPELHFYSDSSLDFLSHATKWGFYATPDSATYVLTDDRVKFCFYTRSGSSGPWSVNTPSLSVKSRTYCVNAVANAFLTCFGKGSLGEHLGFQSDTFFTDLNTPNPWAFMTYLNFYKWFVSNKYVMRGNIYYKKVWFPDNEDDFKFHCGPNNANTGRVGRFFSPTHRSGIRVCGMLFNVYMSNTGASNIKDVDLKVGVWLLLEDLADGSLKKSPSDSTKDLHFTYFDLTGSGTEFEQIRLVNKVRSISYNNWTYNDWQVLWSRVSDYVFERHGLQGYKEGTPTREATVHALDLFKTRYMNFDKDYFTGGLISPLINGDYPKLASVGSRDISGLSASTTLSGGSVSSSVSHSVVGQGNVTDRDYPQALVKGPNGVIGSASLDSVSLSSDEFSSYLKDAFDSILVSSELDLPSAQTSISGSVVVSGSGFSIPDLRLLSATTEYLEALARSDGDYRNMVLAIYGVKPTEVSEAPMFIGGSRGFIQTEDIFQTSPTSDSPLGNVTQTGRGAQNDYIGSVFVKDTTVVIGVVSIVPEIYYYQGVPRKWVMRHKEEHQNPKFNGISMQAIENREIFVSGDDSVDSLPLSYAPAWEFMRHRQNRLSGMCKPHFDVSTGVLLDKPFTQMTQSRGFTETPAFNDDFVSTEGNISTEHLYTQDTSLVPEFVFDIYHDVTELLPITKSGTPAKI